MKWFLLVSLFFTPTSSLAMDPMDLPNGEEEEGNFTYVVRPNIFISGGNNVGASGSVTLRLTHQNRTITGSNELVDGPFPRRTELTVTASGSRPISAGGVWEEITVTFQGMVSDGRSEWDVSCGPRNFRATAREASVLGRATFTFDSDDCTWQQMGVDASTVPTPDPMPE